jgi:hypothetical protein
MRTLGDVFEESANAATAGDYAKALELLTWIHDNPDPLSSVKRDVPARLWLPSVGGTGGGI